jgi:hypothetical protein
MLLSSCLTIFEVSRPESNPWLRRNVHAVNQLETPDQLLRRVTGEPLTTKYFLDYLTTKYTDACQLRPELGAGSRAN